MAQSGKITIKPEHIDDHDGTLRSAMEMWNVRTGPVSYNQWQSAWFTMLRGHGVTDEDARAEEPRAETQERMKTMYEEVQTVNFGSDHRAEALKKQRRAERAPSPAVPAEGEGSTIVAVPQDAGRDAASNLQDRTVGEDGRTPRAETGAHGVAR